jgi:hypothetical protein
LRALRQPLLLVLNALAGCRRTDVGYWRKRTCERTWQIQRSCPPAHDIALDRLRHKGRRASTGIAKDTGRSTTESSAVVDLAIIQADSKCWMLFDRNIGFTRGCRKFGHILGDSLLIFGRRRVDGLKTELCPLLLQFRLIEYSNDCLI